MILDCWTILSGFLKFGGWFCYLERFNDILALSNRVEGLNQLPLPGNRPELVFPPNLDQIAFKLPLHLLKRRQLPNRLILRKRVRIVKQCSPPHIHLLFLQ